MKYALVVIVALAFALLGFAFNINTKPAARETAQAAPTPGDLPVRRPVLVELYTSEGCSSCPPADRALAFLQEHQPVSGARIVALEFHVDYFDSQNWKDAFASPLFTQRQKLYAERYRSDNIYTPQMVVDGAQQFIGSDTLQATNVITEAAKKIKADIALSLEGDKLRVGISGLGKMENATVFLAIAENNISTAIKGGENSGKKLAHSAVVRELRALGTLSGENKTFETETDIQLNPDWKKEDLKAVVFVQENKGRFILGVGELNLAPAATKQSVPGTQ